jgi:hypothetical protein
MAVPNPSSGRSIISPEASILLVVVVGSYRGQLGEGTEGPRGRGQGGSSLEGAGKGRLWRKGSRKEVDGGAQRVNSYPIFLACKCVSKPHRRQPNGSSRL